KMLSQKDLAIDVQYPPLVDDGVLYVPTTFVGPGLEGDASGRAKLFALAADDGRELWSFETGNYILQTPFRDGDTLYVGGSFQASEDVEEGGHTRLYALAADTGMVRWTYESTDGFVKRLYATNTVVAFVAYQDFVTGLDAATGELRWRVEAGNWVPSLSGVGDVIYFGSDNTVLEAHDMNDGRLLWAHNISEGVFNYVLGAPVRVQDDLYFITQRGDIVALNAGDGTLRWKVSTGITSRGGLTVAGGWLFVGGADGRVRAFTGTP
ncbi:MAG: PQQ-binding-like beta-propeller repeat protein, partial [Chloroflexota bacterium]